MRDCAVGAALACFLVAGWFGAAVMVGGLFLGYDHPSDPIVTRLDAAMRAVPTYALGRWLAGSAK